MDQTLQNENRLSNFELLRIVAMFMIVSCHLISHGVQQRSLSVAYETYHAGTLVNRIFSSFLLPGGDVGVAIFFMITGYFQINKDYPNLKKMFLQCCYYGWFTIVLLLLAKLLGFVSELNVSDYRSLIINTFFPLSNGIWWFATAYIFVMIASPMINRIAKEINLIQKKRFVVALIALWIILMVVPSASGTRYGTLYRGFFFYIIGAIIRLKSNYIGKKRNGRRICMLFYLLAWIATAWINFAVQEYNLLYPGLLSLFGYSVVVLICALFLFMFFEQIKMKYNPIVNQIASTTFGIYLIHDSLVGRNLIWGDIFKIDTVVYRTNLFPIWSILIAVIVFTLCSVIDYLRLRFIEPFVMKKADVVKEFFQTER